jgi:fucose permease
MGAFFAFLVFGFTDNLKGPTIPALLKDLGLSYTLGGNILLGVYIGFLIATLFTGIVADLAGKKAVMVAAGVCLALGIAGYSTFQSPILLTLSMGVLGLGLGGLELGSNSIIVEAHPADKGRYLNLMSVMHGMGSMLAPLYAGALLAANVSWRTVYRWDWLPVALLILYFLVLPYPKTASSASDRIDFKHLGKSAFSPQMILFYISIGLYVSVELGIASWVVEFLQKVRGQSVEQSTQVLSLYFGLMMAGRFVGSFFVERVGYLRSILIAMLAAAGCIALGLFGPPAFAILLPATGFFLSIVFPTITAAASDLHTENVSTILGLLFAFAGVGGMLGPWLVGFASDLLGGIQFGFGVNLIYCGLTVLAVLVLMRLTPKNRP